MIIKRPALRLYLGLCFLLPNAAMSEIFSIVIIPDTQMYVETIPEIFSQAQIDWITDHQFDADKNIVYVAHLGDIKDDQFCNNNDVLLIDGITLMSEWDIVRGAFDVLEAAISPGFPDGIPYGLVPGNHDFEAISSQCPTFNINITPRPLTTYNATFGPSTFAGAGYYGGSRLPNDNDDNYTLFSAGGFDFIAINLGYRGDANATDVLGDGAEIGWADARLKEFPNRLGIITTHYVIDCNDNQPACGGVSPANNFSNWGAQLYSGVASNPNLMMMLGAHRWGESWRIEDRSGSSMEPVHVMLADYQRMLYPVGGNFSNIFEAPGGVGDSGLMRIMTFDTVTGIVTTTTFSPADVAALVGAPPTATDLVSTYFPYAAQLADNVITVAEMTTINNDDTQMTPSTGSNVHFSFLGYVNPQASAELVSCGIDNTGGDRLFRGFYHPSYPGSTLGTVELFISSRAAGNHTIRLDARQNTYDGALIASNSQTRTLSGVDTDNVSFLFDMGDAAVTPGNTVTFTLTKEFGQATELFYATDAADFPIGGGGPGSCDVIQTSGTTPPLDTLRRNGLWIRINGAP